MIYPASSSTLIRCTVADVVCSTIIDVPFPSQLRCISKRFRPASLSAWILYRRSFDWRHYPNLSKCSHLGEPSVNEKSQAHSTWLFGTGYMHWDMLHCGRCCFRADCRIRSKILILLVIDSENRMEDKKEYVKRAQLEDWTFVITVRVQASHHSRVATQLLNIWMSETFKQPSTWTCFNWLAVSKITE